jgi:hypothetical protein
MKQFFISLVIGIAIIGGYFSPLSKTIQSLGAPVVNFVGTLPTTLSGAGITSTVTSVGVTSLTIQQTGQKVSMTDFGSIGYATIDPGNATKQEFVSFTGITQNSNGTAILTGVTRGLSPVSPYTASSTMRFAHGGGSRVIISNSPPFYNNFAIQGNSADVTGLWTFSSATPPRYDVPPPNQTVGSYQSTTSELVSWAGLAAVTTAGAPNMTTAVKGIAEQATVSEATSSTATGGTGANLVIGANLVSGMPGVSLIPMTQPDGKLLQGWFDFTLPWTFQATTTFSNDILATKGWEGDGSDGDVTISGTTTLSRDMYYNNLTVPVGNGIIPNGYKIFVKETATINGGIAFSGNDGSTGSTGTQYDSNTCATPNYGGAPGAVLNSGTIRYSATSTTGGREACTYNSANNSLASGGVPVALGSIGVQGASGGRGGDCTNNCSSSGTTGGTGGTVGTVASTTSNPPNSIENIAKLLDFASATSTAGWTWYHIEASAGSTGGGSGGSGGDSGDASQSFGTGGGGGGAGSTGGLVLLIAKKVTGSGFVWAKGGNGGNGGAGGTVNTGNKSGVGGGGGGGSGGSGGVILIGYQSYTFTGSMSVSGGTGGTGGAIGGGTGVTTGATAGSNGSSGRTGFIKKIKY